MPRRPRPDLEPEIWIDDTSEEEEHIRPDMRQHGKGVFFYRDDPSRQSFIGSFVHFDPAELDWLIKCSGIEQKQFDHNVIHRLLALTRRSQIGRVALERKDGKVRVSLRIVGCRAHFGSESQLAVSLGRSRSYVHEQLKLFKKAGIITNAGHGWCDLNAYVAWRGSRAHHMAYCDEYPQPGHFEIKGSDEATYCNDNEMTLQYRRTERN